MILVNGTTVIEDVYITDSTVLLDFFGTFDYLEFFFRTRTPPLISYRMCKALIRRGWHHRKKSYDNGPITPPHYIQLPHKEVNNHIWNL